MSEDYFGPGDEDETAPMLPNEGHHPHRYFYVCGSILGIVIIGLTLVSIAFGVLYFNQLSESDRPKWPGPSISPLGKYEKAAVAADNEYCSEIGRNILLHGGNAVDAAIAALFCIGVMDTHSAGIGGGHFMTIYNATTKKCFVVDAREEAPLSASENMFKDKWMEAQIGWRAVAVPGEIHGMWTEFQQFGSGKVSWKSLIDPTIDLLAEGYPTSHALAGALREKRKEILNEPTMKAFINPLTNDVYKAGEQISTRTTFLRTLQILANASNPVEEFYSGEMARQMAEEFKRHGGHVTLEDLQQYRSIVRNDSEVLYTRLTDGRVICGPPPPAGAAVAQAILNIMDGYKSNMSSFEGTTTFFHNFIEASKFAYAGRSHLGDSAFVHNATHIARNITTPEWAEWVRSQITDTAHPDAYYGGSFEVAVEDHGTTSITAIDIHGNAVSVTSTINLYLGAIVASESTGIVWNDEMDDFSLPGHPNYFKFPPSPANFIKPRKRPQSSMSPIVIYDENDRNQLLAVGGAGGSTIISGVAGVSLHALWLQDNIKAAVDFPRLHNQLQPNITQYEDNFPKAYVKALSDRGHKMVRSSNLTVVTAVERAADGQTYANSDFRKGEESAPAGY